MTSVNLTHKEAQERSALLSNIHYDITLDLRQGEDLDHPTFLSHTVINFDSKEGSTFIDLRAQRVLDINLDGVSILDTALPLKADQYDEEKGIHLSNLSSGHHTLSITADCLYSTTGEGLHRFRDPADDEVYMYTQFETADAKRVFACFDQPDLKATYTMSVHTPEKWTVVTNNAVETTEAAETTLGPTSLPAGGIVSTSTIDYPLSTYLIAFCIGPWHVVQDQWTGTLRQYPETAEFTHPSPKGKISDDSEITIPMNIYCRQSLAEYLDADEIFTITKQGFDFYHANFGIAYPFYKYDQIFCPEYNMGAMENAGCVTFRDEYIFRSTASHYQYERRADTILHEMAHMWFGDLVTMQWWDDLWLNESFATWSSALAQAEATQFRTAWVTFAQVEKSWAYQQDQLSSTHPVFTDAQDLVTVAANFDGITYAKGASVLKQLVAYVGLEDFLSGLRTHFAAHAFSNATFHDLLSALEQSSGKDLSDWADQWLKTTGINTLSAHFSISDGKYNSFAIQQSPAEPGAGELRPHRIGVGIYTQNDRGILQRKTYQELDIYGAKTEVPALHRVEAGDLLLLNDKDLSYAFTSLDSHSLATVLQGIEKVEDEMARSLLWSATWQMVRNAELPARDFVRLVAQGIESETELAVLESVLNKASAAVAHYVSPSWQEEGWDLLRSAFLRAAKNRHGQAQLSFIRSFIGAQHNASSIQYLINLFNTGSHQDSQGETDIPGLVLDNELRWAIIKARAASTNISGEKIEDLLTLIEAEEKADHSATGAMHAVAARASFPTMDTKKRVWEEIISQGAQLSNLRLRFLEQGFRRVGHEDLLMEFTSSYVDHAAQLWNSLSSEMALRTLSGFYPSWDHREDSDAALATLAAAEDTPSGLKRVLNEGRDAVARAKKARHADSLRDS